MKKRSVRARPNVKVEVSATSMMRPPRVVTKMAITTSLMRTMKMKARKRKSRTWLSKHQALKMRKRKILKR